MATFVVTVSADTADGDYSRNDLSLREAITLANSREGADRIIFADDVHRVTLRDALPIVRDDLRLVGGGDVVLDANAGRSDEEQRRVLDIRGDDLNTTIDGLTITGGGHSGGGAGIRSGRGVDLRMVDCEIVGNRVHGYSSADRDGGGISAQGNLTLLRSRVADNETTDDGGGIAVFGKGIVRGSTIEGNEANGSYGSGGGILATDGLRITNSDVLANRANVEIHYGSPPGGGISVIGDLTVVRSRVEGNSAGPGGGIWASGKATILHSKVVGNEGYSGGGILARGDIHVWRSHIVENVSVAPEFGDADGGGIAGQSDVTLSRTRILGNEVHGFGYSAFGGGVSALGSVEADNCVIVGNRATGGGAFGGGIFADTVELTGR